MRCSRTVKTLVPHDFEPVVCQASVYTPDGELPVTRLFRELFPTWQDRFNTEPGVVPDPASSHPRILLASATGMWRCEIAADRADLYWIRPEPRAPAPSIDDFFAVASQMLSQYAEVARSRIGRFAAIVNRVTGHSAPALVLVKHLLRPELATSALSGLESFELATHKRISLGERFLVNAWLRCQTPDDPSRGARPAILVHQDVNTLPEQAVSREFTTDDLGEFFALAARDHERSLSELLAPGAR
jgi:hypothetical protein